MIDKARNKTFWSSAVVLSEWKYRTEADAVERQLVLDQLEAALTRYTADEKINWYGHEIELQPGSSLYEIYNPGMLMLNDLLDTGPVFGALAREDARDHRGLIRVTADGKMEVRADRGWVDLVAARHFEYSVPTQSALTVISDIAGVAGGYVWPDNDITLDQWFRFHDIKLPENNTKVRELIALFKFDPQVQEPGNYWDHFQSDSQAFVALTEEQLSAIRGVTSKLMLTRKLLRALHKASGRATVSPASANQVIGELLKHPVSQAYAKRYLDELGWYGANEGELVSEQFLCQLLTTAILLDLDPSIGHSHRRKRINGLDLYAPSNVERHPSLIREEVAAFLRAKQWVDFDLAPLAAHLLLARDAPEFLVREIPPSITLGSIAWINFCRGVLLVEAAKSGATRVMTYAQIMAYAELEPISDAQQHLRDLAMIDPIVDWALLNQVVTRAELEQAEETSTQRAIDAFEQHSEKFAQIAKAFSTPLPDRAEIARTALKAAAPGCDSLDEKALSKIGGQQVMSMVDLHQSGDLVTGQWDRRTVRLVTNGLPKPDINYNPSGVSLYTRYPQLLTLKSCDEELDRQLAAFRSELNGAMLSSVKLALAHMPEGDLQIFMNAEINFFTVRESAVYIKKVPVTIHPPTTRDVEIETQQSRDAATGRFGIVMCAAHKNTLICYELFTSRAECRKNNTLGEFIRREGKLQQTSRMDFAEALTDWQTTTVTQNLPLNVSRYTHASAEDTLITHSSAVIDKFGTLAKSSGSSSLKKGFYQKFNDPAVARIAAFIVNNRPFLKE